MSDPEWLIIARELQAIAQTGLHFTQDAFDRDRFTRVRELAARLIARGSGDETAHVLRLLQGTEGYATPKVDVRGAIVVDGRILLVREVSDGKWTLPGGWADVNQTPAQCVEREINEESGYEARALKLVAVHDYQTRQPVRHLDSIYKLFFLCELTGGAPRTSNETSEVEFFAVDALPPLSLGRTTVAQIELMFRHAADPTLPPEFD